MYLSLWKDTSRWIVLTVALLVPFPLLHELVSQDTKQMQNN